MTEYSFSSLTNITPALPAQDVVCATSVHSSDIDRRAKRRTSNRKIPLLNATRHASIAPVDYAFRPPSRSFSSASAPSMRDPSEIAAASPSHLAVQRHELRPRHLRSEVLSPSRLRCSVLALKPGWMFRRECWMVRQFPMLAIALRKFFAASA